MFQSGASGLEWLRQRVSSGQPATLAVAFWGAEARHHLGLARRAAAAPIRIICNLAMGGTNPFEIEELMSTAGVSVEQSDHLHGKVYLFDDAVMIGSSNASANGLSFEGVEALSWQEANIVSEDRAILAAAAEWVAQLSTRAITPQDLSDAKLAWRLRRSNIIAPNHKRSIVDLLADGPSSIVGKGVYLAVYTAELDKRGLEARDVARTEYGPHVDAFQDWGDLPQNGTFICFWRGARGGIQFDDAWKRASDLPDLAFEGGTLQLCFPTKMPLGLIHPRIDREGWREVVKRLIDRASPVQGNIGWFADLADLRP